MPSWFDQFKDKNTHEQWADAVKKYVETAKKGNSGETSLGNAQQKGKRSDSQGEEVEATRSFNKSTQALNPKKENVEQNKARDFQEENGSQNSLPNNQEYGPAAQGAIEPNYAEMEKNFLAENKELREERAKEIINRLNEQKNIYQKQRMAIHETQYEIGDGKEVYNWKKILKKALLDEETRWSYRRSGRSNDYMARAEELEDETKSESEVLLDVSGSVTDRMLRGFLHQLRPLLKHTTFKVGCFDSEFYGFTEIKKNSDIDTFRIVSCGGWEDFDNAVRQFSKKKEVNKIIFTDGGNPPGDMPRQDLKNVNVIWIVFYNREFNPCCGKVIHIELEDLYKNQINLLRMKNNFSRQRD